ncbi:hypothetical protein MNBD_GAMMA02-793, partial [hydrothermal vent metagenome]
MFKFVHTVYYNSAEDRRSGFELYSSQPEFNEQLVLQLQQQIQDQNPVIVVDAQAHLPPFWQPRLLQAMTENDAINHISALSTQRHELSPLTQDFGGTLAQLDQVTYLLQHPHYFLSNAFNKACFAVRNIEVLAADEPKYAVNNLVVDVPPADRQPILAAVQPDIGDQRPLPAHPLAELQLKLKDVETETIKTGYPGLDQKPVALHTVMDWGGGVHQWVNDFINNHADMHHVVLSSQGEFFRQQQGERFQLHWLNTSGLVLDEFHLTKAIKATAPQHPQYQAMIDSIIKRWDVQQLVVSSLIGHAMDCLNTGLPTLRILHDYFPHWPSLNAQLDASVVDQKMIDQALMDTHNEPFGEIEPTDLIHWQQTNNQLLEQDNIKIIAPDESVKINLLKLPHSSCYEKTQVIPHALEPLAPIKYQAENVPFKVLVLGRISPPKGQCLLHECVQKLADNDTVEFVLLGAGINGKEFEDYTNARVIADFDQTSLAQILSEISPQLGLLTALTAETFSYTLSEILMSGIPVLTTPVGALKNRINEGVNGLLVSFQAEQITEQILNLQRQPEKLEKLHQGALNTKLVTVEQNKAAFTQLLKPSQTNLRPYKTEGLLTLGPMVQKLQISQRLADGLSKALSVTELNLTEKTNWAKQLTEQNQHLADNIALGRKEIKHLISTIKKQTVAHDSEVGHLKQAIVQINNHLETINEELDETKQLRNQLTADNAMLSQTVHAVQKSIENMVNSRSWRVTKPLRAFTTYARHKRNALKFRYAQLKGLPKRVANSLRSRGLKQTALMAKNKLNKPKPQSTATAHAVTED